MAIQTQIVTGYVSRPSGDPVTVGKVRFSLSRYDTTGGGLIVAHEAVDAQIESDGSIGLVLWPNTRGRAGTVYNLSLLDENGKVVESLGRIQVDENGPHDLDALYAAFHPAPGNPPISAVIKKGDAIAWRGTRYHQGPHGHPADPHPLDSSTIYAQLRRGIELVDLSVDVTDAAAGEFTLFADGVTTEEIPSGVWEYDIRFADAANDITSTETFYCMVVEAVSDA